MIRELFKDISSEKEFYQSANNGEQFEQKIKNKLKALGFSELIHIMKKENIYSEISNFEGISKNEAKKIYKNIRGQILMKNSLDVTKNPFKKIYNAFIFQPYGSQNFPDFLIFLKNYVIPIEVKFSKSHEKNINKTFPMWNSNLPKPNAIYIFGVSAKAVTYFIGSDVLDYKTREVLLNFFENIDSEKADLDNKLKTLRNNFGYYPYVRKAYEHKAAKSTYINPLTGVLEIQSYFNDQEKKEKKVLKFLDALEN